jgi:hypothetical protein
MIKLQNLITESYHLDTAYTVGPSTINGKGVIAIKSIPASCKGLAHVHSHDFKTYLFTDLGYFINHSDTPNCEMIVNSNRRYIRVLQDIQSDEELTCNYWHCPKDLERPTQFKEFERDANGMRIYPHGHSKIISRIANPHIKYAITKR